MKYNTATLDNGLRVIHLPSASPVVYCGYQICAGSRHEGPGEEGLAHFCEHATFKGTGRRKSCNILNSLESVGGDLNAFTNKEDTTYHVAVLKDHIGRAIDVLTDMVFHSTYPQNELEKEVEVICDEIESYNDSPAELIYDEFENLIFKGHPIGHAILGTTENVRSFGHDKALAFARKYYRPDNAIFFAYGDVEFKKLVRSLSCHTSDLSPGPSPLEEESPQPVKLEEKGKHGVSNEKVSSQESASVTEEEHHTDSASSFPIKEKSGRRLVISKGTHQAHVMLGSLAYSIHDKRRMSLYLLNNMLGGPGMNARLNLMLREKNGLVYTVESSMVSYGDTGMWCVYFGCDPHDVERCLKIVRKELDKLMKQPISETRLNAAKKQIKGQIGVACDHRESFALDFGKSFLHYGWEKDIAALYRNIDDVTAESIREVAKEIFEPGRITTLIYQ